jgi:hypothetical protein
MKKTKEITAILINPFTREVTEVTYSGDYKQIYELIDCTTFGAPYLTNGDSIYCDDEGLYKSVIVPFITSLFSKTHPLVNKCLILGTNRENGESISTSLTVEEVRQSIKWTI